MLAIIIASLVTLCGAAFAIIQYRTLRLFRGYQDVAKDLRRVAEKLNRCHISRDNDDVLITGQLEGTSVSLRFSHSESAPGMYIRAVAPVDFSLIFSAKTLDDVGADDVYRIGNQSFDMRFAGRTDNRAKTKQFLSQPDCLDHLQLLCCSNKTMLRLADGNIELSEALIPSDTARHVGSHLQSLAFFARQLSTMPWNARSKSVPAPVQALHWVPKLAFVMVITIAIAGLLLIAEEPSAQVQATSSVSTGVEGMSSKDSVLISNPAGWQKATAQDLNPDFSSWLNQRSVVPATQLSMDATGKGSETGLAYLLKSEENPKVKRLVWIADRKIFCDLSGRIDGMARIPKDSLLGLSWTEGGTPVSEPEGDGLLVVRNHQDTSTATVYFVTHGELHSAIPADFNQISFR